MLPILKKKNRPKAEKKDTGKDTLKTRKGYKMSSETVGYKINWKTNTITITKAFAKKASQQGTPEYNILLEARRSGFYLTERPKQERRACPTRITFAQMENYISCLDDKDKRLEELHAVMNLGKSTTNQYEHVRKWFLENYPDFNKIPVRDEDNCLTSSQVRVVPLSDNVCRIGA